MSARTLTCFRGLKGPAQKCPAIAQALWQWFVNIRSSVETVMSPKYLLRSAKYIADQVVAAMTDEGEYIEVPLIDMRWFRRWRQDHGVVLMQPNRRYKVPWPLMVERLCYMWMNNFSVRYLAHKFLGRTSRTRFSASTRSQSTLTSRGPRK